MKADLPDFSDDDALGLIHAVRRTHGFAMLVMTRGDVESLWHDTFPDDADIPDHMPEDLWAKVQGTWAWRKGFSESPIMDRAWDLVRDALNDAMKEDEENAAKN